MFVRSVCLGTGISGRLRVGTDVVTAAPEGVEGVDDGEDGEEDPEEEAKRNGGLARAAVRVGPAMPGAADGDGQGDGAGEPEDGGQGVEDQRGQAVEQARQVQRRQPDVRQHQQRPHRVEDHEVDPRRPGPPAPPGIIPARDVCREPEFDDGEDGGHDVDDRYKSKRHLDLLLRFDVGLVTLVKEDGRW